MPQAIPTTQETKPGAGRRPPGPRSLSPLGSAPAIGRDSRGFALEMWQRCRPRFAYFHFGGGPRQCIGNTFALMEAQLVLATVAQHYSLHLVPGHTVEPQVLLTVRPRYGLPMTLQAR